VAKKRETTPAAIFDMFLSTVDALIVKIQTRHIVPTIEEMPTIFEKLTTPFPIIWGKDMITIQRKLVYPSTGELPGL